MTPRAFKDKSIALLAGGMFEAHAQHDAQELLAHLLDGLHEDLNQGGCVGNTAVGNGSDEMQAARAWRSHVKRNKSIIVDLFHGQLRSAVRCNSCGHASRTYDPFMYLSLPLDGGGTAGNSGKPKATPRRPSPMRRRRPSDSPCSANVASCESVPR